MSPPAPVAVPTTALGLYDDYLAWLAARGVGNRSYLSGARAFLARHPDPQESWAALPLATRLASAHAASAAAQLPDAARPPAPRL